MNRNKRTLIALFAVCALVSILTSYRFRDYRSLAQSMERTKNTNFKTTKKPLSSEQFKGSRDADPNSSVESPAVAIANKYIIDNPKLFPIQSYHQLEITTRMSPLGSFVSYHIFQDGFKLIGMQIDLLVSKFGKVKVVSNEYHSIEKVDTDRSSWLSLKEVSRGQESVFKFVDGFADSSKEEIAIWVSPNSSKAELVYVVSVIDPKQKQKVSGQAVFSVTDGQLLARYFPRPEF